MDVVVVFKFPDIPDPGSAEADSAIESLTLDLKKAGIDCEEWFIEDAIGDAQQGGTHG